MTDVSDVYLTHDGVTVYHINKNDDPAQGRRKFWFTTNPCGGETRDDDWEFDVRDLDVLDDDDDLLDGVARGDDEAISRAIVLAIDAGEVTAPEGT